MLVKVDDHVVCQSCIYFDKYYDCCDFLERAGYCRTLTKDGKRKPIPKGYCDSYEEAVKNGRKQGNKG